MIINKFGNFYKEYKRMPTISEVLRHFNIRFIEMPLPAFAQIEPTTRCNFNCITCTRKTLNPNRLNRDLTLEEFKIILDKIPTLKSIKLQGMGEPFLNPKLKSILEYGKEKGIVFTTICNGSLLEYKLDLLKYFSYIFVSFDSANKFNFENIRKGSNFDIICQNLQSIIAYRNEHKLTNKIGLNSVITHLNYKEIPQIVKIANDFKLDSVGFVEVENWSIPSEKNFIQDQKFIN
ncbi:MAG: radical SAM protein, partial [Parcubacteria group bacterium]|nr:radical SAM protein [Parcubacteria group bacterium]